MKLSLESQWVSLSVRHVQVRIHAFIGGQYSSVFWLDDARHVDATPEIVGTDFHFPLAFL